MVEQQAESLPYADAEMLSARSSLPTIVFLNGLGVFVMSSIQSKMIMLYSK